MRLTQRDIDAIKAAAAEAFGASATVRLFGSRVRDELRGGDIDLLIEADRSDATEWQRISAFRDTLFQHIDEQKVDVVVIERGSAPSPFAQLVAGDAVPIP